MSDQTDTQPEPSEPEQPERDANALPTPQEKYEGYEADRKRLAEEHGAA